MVAAMGCQQSQTPAIHTEYRMLSVLLMIRMDPRRALLGTDLAHRQLHGYAKGALRHSGKPSYVMCRFSSNSQNINQSFDVCSLISKGFHYNNYHHYHHILEKFLRQAILIECGTPCGSRILQLFRTKL